MRQKNWREKLWKVSRKDGLLSSHNRHLSKWKSINFTVCHPHHMFLTNYCWTHEVLHNMRLSLSWLVCLSVSLFRSDGISSLGRFEVSFQERQSMEIGGWEWAHQKVTLLSCEMLRGVLHFPWIFALSFRLWIYFLKKGIKEMFYANYFTQKRKENKLVPVSENIKGGAWEVCQK